MKKYEPKRMVASSRYQNYFPTLPAEIQQDVHPSIAVFDALLEEGVERSEAEAFVTDYYRWRSQGMASKIKVVFKIPGLYKIVPKFFQPDTEELWPQSGILL